jgi:hypothetical protein
MTDFNSVNGDDGVYMLTAQNKSFDGLTLTGTWYYGPDLGGSDDVHILWGDIAYAADSFYAAGQVGTVMSDAFNDDTVAFGVKAGTDLGMFNVELAYSNVNEGDAGLHNVGGVKTPLYTQMILNQNFIRSDNDTFVARAGMKALGGKFGLAYDYTTDNSALENDYTELGLTYKTKAFNDTTTLFAGYIFRDADAWADSQNILRFWARYNF